MKHSKQHPGFKSVQSKIAAKEGVSKKAAGAILASKTRKASAAAKKANPRLNRVKGAKEGSKAEERRESPKKERAEKKMGMDKHPSRKMAARAAKHLFG